MAAADHAWRSMFLTVMYPGALFFVGCCLVSESPRWLIRQARPEKARAALARLLPPAAAESEFKEIVDARDAWEAEGVPGAAQPRFGHVVDHGDERIPAPPLPAVRLTPRRRRD